MNKISIHFPAKLVAHAEILSDKEPTLAQDFLNKLAVSQEFVCNHSVCAGKIFDAYARFSAEPTEKVEGVKKVSFGELSKGDLLWDGEKLSVVYGDVVQPGTAGYVIGKIEVTPEMEKACLNVWYDIYREHQVTVVTIEKE